MNTQGLDITQLAKTPIGRRALPALPKYVAVAESIRAQITSGEYRAGDKLPAERQIAADFGIAYCTARQAVGLLVQEGLVERRHGHGTFAADPAESEARRARLDRAPATIALVGFENACDESSVSAYWEWRYRLYQGVVEACFAHGVRCEARELSVSDEDPRALRDSLAGIGGIILGKICIPEEEVRVLRAAGIPVVSHGNYAPGVCSLVWIDKAGGVRDAFRYLIGLGHRDIGFIDHARQTRAAEERLQAYRDALAEAGIPIRPELRVAAEHSREPQGREAALRLLKLDQPPTAIFALADLLAIGAMDAAKSLGLRVPEDVALVGNDDISVAATSDPPLTTMHTPYREAGRTAVDVLLGHMNGLYADPQTRILSKHLVIRGSCGGAESREGSAAD
ncbi:MAG: GntR family transcriptional regulator [Kiritimatiellae bacterium]|nr:GntR family transcriptional regulator [Kiritimatiellia bacterium]